MRRGVRAVAQVFGREAGSIRERNVIMKNLADLETACLLTEAVVEAIRRQYPHPRPPAARGDYCVGGAFLTYFHSCGRKDLQSLAFPSSRQLAAGLQRINPRLDHATAERYAARIVARNDAYAVEEAWETLHGALSWGASAGGRSHGSNGKPGTAQPRSGTPAPA